MRVRGRCEWPSRQWHTTERETQKFLKETLALSRGNYSERHECTRVLQFFVYGDLRMAFRFSQGEAWHRFRKNVNQHMMQPRSIKPHVAEVDEVASDFIARIRKLRDVKTLKLPTTFNNEMNKWALECKCAGKCPATFY